MKEITINIHNLSGSTSPGDYVLDDSLKATVELAIALNKPLLVTGAPGTGKTQLAHKIAFELSKDTRNSFNFLPQPWTFNTKTTSTARDLFYQYDAIGHFQRKGAENKTDVSVSDYIQLNALGAAIVHTRIGNKKNAAKHPSVISEDRKKKEAGLTDEAIAAISKKMEEDEDKLRKISRDKLKDTPMSSVVLIDEIDKAPRDFPNDLLNEIENYQFYISELDLTVRAASPDAARIIIIMTSNFEKNLPPAFLRRCLFYNIPTPKGKALLDIVVARMTAFLEQRFLEQKKPMLSEEQIRDRYKSIVEAFDAWGETLNDKAPATAELLEWLKALELYQFFNEKRDFNALTDHQKKILQYTFPILAKSKDDVDTLANLLK